MIKLFDKFRFYKKGLNIAYSAVVLEPQSKELLLTKFIYSDPIYNTWTKLADHMTICLGELPEHLKRYWLDEELSLTVKEIGYSDKAVAVKVTGFIIISKQKHDVDSNNKIQHITLAINPIGGKPVDSNDITKWKKIEPIKIWGNVSEIKR